MVDTANHRLGPRLPESNSSARRVTVSARDTTELSYPRRFGEPSLPPVAVAGHLGTILRFGRNTSPIKQRRALALQDPLSSTHSAWHVDVWASLNLNLRGRSQPVCRHSLLHVCAIAVARYVILFDGRSAANFQRLLESVRVIYSKQHIQSHRRALTEGAHQPPFWKGY